MARMLNWELIDLDELVSGQAGRTIPEMFEEGEKVFRVAERRELERIIQREDMVVALGGGALMWADNLDLVRRNGMLAYLRADTDSLFRRLSESVHDRPMLGGRTGDELRTHIDNLLENRRPYYEAADITVDASDNRTVEAIAEDIVNAFRSRLPADTG
ncbi:shikimate kinase [Gemmatimonadota bacterium]